MLVVLASEIYTRNFRFSCRQTQSTIKTRLSPAQIWPHAHKHALPLGGGGKIPRNIQLTPNYVLFPRRALADCSWCLPAKSTRTHSISTADKQKKYSAPFPNANTPSCTHKNLPFSFSFACRAVCCVVVVLCCLSRRVLYYTSCVFVCVTCFSYCRRFIYKGDASTHAEGTDPTNKHSLFNFMLQASACRLLAVLGLTPSLHSQPAISTKTQIQTRLFLT